MSLISELNDNPVASGDMDRDLLGTGQESLLNDSVGAALSNTNMPATDQGGIDALLKQDQNSVFAGLNPSSGMSADLDPIPAVDSAFASAEITSGQTLSQNEANIRSQVQARFRQGNGMGNDQREMEAATLAANKATSTIQKDVQQRSASALREDMVDGLSQEQADKFDDLLDQKLSEEQKQQMADAMSDVMASRLAEEIDQPLEQGMEESLQQDQELKESMAKEMASALTTDQKEALASDLADSMLDQEGLADARIEALEEMLEIEDDIGLTQVERDELAASIADDQLEQLSVEEKQELAEKYADKLAPELREQLANDEIDLAIEAMPERDLDMLRTEMAQELSDEQKLAIANDLVEQLDEQQMGELLEEITPAQEEQIYSALDELPVEEKVDIYANMERAGLSPEQLDQLADNIDLNLEEQAQAISDRMLELEAQPELEVDAEMNESALVASEQELDADLSGPGQIGGAAVAQQNRINNILDVMKQVTQEQEPSLSTAV